MQKNNCEFKVKQCDFDIEIKQVIPFSVHGCKPLVLDLNIIQCPYTKNHINIQSNPCHGKLYKFEPLTLVYKADKNFFGMDMFQLVIEDECGNKSYKSVLINVK